MSLYVASLNSGSNGNCYYISNGKDAVLVDAGLSCKETEKRMNVLGLSMKNVRAVFISHEHIDHIKGVPVLSKKYRLPVYITRNTYTYSRMGLDAELVRHFNAGDSIQVNRMMVHSFSKIHDAVEPTSFTIEGNGVTIGVFTDIGEACDNVMRQFQRCDAAFLEANYDATMLEFGRYPIHLKNRIRGGKGHLSNEQALAVFRNYKPQKMTHVFLSHLSQDNNNPDLAADLFKAHAQDVNIIVASRHEHTAVYHIKSNAAKDLVQHVQYQQPVQASLF
jgi:phosphoribosyl 1,2-cyclic phosphodiesterase